jgi:hypothetical protein
MQRLCTKELEHITHSDRFFKFNADIAQQEEDKIFDTKVLLTCASSILPTRSPQWVNFYFHERYSGS